MERELGEVRDRGVLRDLEGLDDGFLREQAHGLRMGDVLVVDGVHELAHAFDGHGGVSFHERHIGCEQLGGVGECFLIQALLVAEVVVDHALGHAGSTGNGVELRLGETLVGKLLCSNFDDPLDGDLGRGGAGCLGRSVVICNHRCGSPFLTFFCLSIVPEKRGP